MRASHDYVVVDVFTSRPLEGNPLAVLPDASTLTEDQMQRIAVEMRHSETTFVLPPEQGGDARVRFFTPVNELPFAGHPLLGTAIVLGEGNGARRLTLETGMGPIAVDLDRVSESVLSGRMWQPIPTWEPYEHEAELLVALGVTSSLLPVEAYRNGPRHVYVALASEERLAGLRPDTRALARLPDMAAICFAGAGSHWTVRMFSPAYGVVEDAGTGSAAGPLALHLARHGLIPFGLRLKIRQGLEMGRPSTLFARCVGGDGGITAVEVSGAAVITARGTLYL